MQGLEGFVGPDADAWRGALFPGGDEFAHLVGLQTDEGLSVLPVMTLSFRVPIIQHTHLPHQINYLHLTIVILHRLDYSFQIPQPYPIHPVDIKTHITVGVLNFLLIKCL